MALPAVLMGSAAVLGAIIALLTATYLFDDLDPIAPNMSLTFQACSDGVDNDRDGKTDAKDPGCSSRTNPAEKDPACSDGVDKDRDGKTDLTRIRLLVAHRPLREVTSGRTVFRLSRSVESNLIGDHRRTERRRPALLECLALSVEVGEVQRAAGELSSELVRALRRLPAADRNALLLVSADSEASRYARFADQLTSSCKAPRLTAQPPPEHASSSRTASEQAACAAGRSATAADMTPSVPAPPSRSTAIPAR
jgi:hypothetical protein